MMVTGVATSFAMNTNSADILSYSNLGSGAEIRSELLQMNDISASGLKALNSETTFALIELTRGEV